LRTTAHERILHPAPKELSLIPRLWECRYAFSRWSAVSTKRNNAGLGFLAGFAALKAGEPRAFLKDQRPFGVHHKSKRTDPKCGKVARIPESGRRASRYRTQETQSAVDEVCSTGTSEV
jgi:hypothetical protein